MGKTKYIALHYHPDEVLKFIKHNLEMARKAEPESPLVLLLEDTATLLESISEARHIRDLRGVVKS